MLAMFFISSALICFAAACQPTVSSFRVYTGDVVVEVPLFGVDHNVASSSLEWRGNYSYREAGSGGPGAVASGADDSALVNVSGGDEALVIHR